MEQNKTLHKIQQILDEKNWSKYKLAQASNIPYSSLNSMFNKNTQPSLATLEKMCMGLDITMSEFFSNDTPIKKDNEHYSSEELDLIDMYRSLKKSDKKLLLIYMKGFSKKPL